MLATLPPHHHREAPNVLNVCVAIALLLSPFLLKLQFDLHRHRSVASEFQSSRESILSRIEAASADNDFDALTLIRDRYASAVADRDFRSTLSHALARAASREAEFRFAISRHLDLIRHQEETPAAEIRVTAADQPPSNLLR